MATARTRAWKDGFSPFQKEGGEGLAGPGLEAGRENSGVSTVLTPERKGGRRRWAGEGQERGNGMNYAKKKKKKKHPILHSGGSAAQRGTRKMSPPVSPAPKLLARSSF